MSRVLVTGATSFSARHLRERLHADQPGAEVWGTDLATPSAGEQPFRAADLTRPGDADTLIAEVAPERVVHLAGVSSPDAERCFAVNLDGTRRLLEACARRARPPAVILVSSASVYGLTRPEESPVVEGTPLRPVTPYGASKAAAELLALSMHRRGLVPVTVVRPFNLIGPGLRAGFAPSDFLAQAVAARAAGPGAEIRVGDLEPRRDFVDVRDAVAAYAVLLDREDLRGQVFNVATGRPVSVRELLDAVLAITGVQARVVVEPSRQRAVQVLEQVGDAAALRHRTGWSPVHTLERSLRDMAG
jgi:GDP-4-dehydro-6-deoxy-D-mannose reductase